MWECCGVVRSEETLREGLSRVAEIGALVDDVDVSPSAEGYADLAQALDLRGSVVVGLATISSALERRETRGAHYRLDYPDLDPTLLVNFNASLQDASVRIDGAPVPPVPDELRSWVSHTAEVEVHGRLLE